ncbi:hypothetical protein B0H17DRAFT_1145404 [Mycena rosella]|uniref:Uncharacterized protein n=1 Tax=Mycena rosella TaxID=1033263 RepID=A0AAD7CR08_MYCRO|nr:hypothetical protein B0H17DRAFT_1145404 [Mycena rosella]
MQPHIEKLGVYVFLQQHTRMVSILPTYTGGMEVDCVDLKVGKAHIVDDQRKGHQAQCLWIQRVWAYSSTLNGRLATYFGVRILRLKAPQSNSGHNPLANGNRPLLENATIGVIVSHVDINASASDERAPNSINAHPIGLEVLEEI